MNTSTRAHRIARSITIGLVAAAILLAAGFAYANPFYLGKGAYSATATSTLMYLTPGTATTTTPIYDSYEQNGTNEQNSGNITIPDSIAIMVQGRASSTSTTLNITCEFSEDLIDWYQDGLIEATSTAAVPIGIASSFTYTYASSTSMVGGVSSGVSTNRFQKVITCPVPLRYVRTVITNTGAGAGVWIGILPKKQRN